MALLYGEPQGGGEASAFAIAEKRRSTYCDSLTCICFDAEVAEVEWPAGRTHMDKNEPNPFLLTEQDALDREHNRRVLYGDLPLNDNGVYACALGTCDPEWDCGGHVVEYTKPSNAAVTAFAGANALPWTVGEGMLNPDETDPAWADMGICTMCGKAGLFGSPHVTVDIFFGATDCGTFA